MAQKTNDRTSATKTEVERIANEIVDLVERTDGPVLLNEVDEIVRGFSKPRGPSYSYFASKNGREVTFWYNMTYAGQKALQHVLETRRVAVQLVNQLPYFLEGVRFCDDTWQPIVLLPLRAANLETPNFNVRLTANLQKAYLEHVRATRRVGYRPLAPLPVRFTADRFSL